MKTNLSTLAAACCLAAVAGAAHATSYVSVQTTSTANQGETNSISTTYESTTGLRVDQNLGNTSYLPTSALLGLAAISMTNAATASTGVSTTATAAADLADATMRAFAGGFGLGLTGPFDGFGMMASAAVTLRDGVRFSVAGGGTATVTLHGHIGGLIAVTAPTGFNGAQVFERVQLGGNQFAFFSPADNNFGFYDQFGNLPSGWTAYSISNVTRTGGDFVGMFTVHDGEFMDFHSSLNVRCDGKVVCDYMNTASIGLALPEGVTFTSDSGVFLTAVPEPGGAALMMVGLGALGCFLRRQRG